MKNFIFILLLFIQFVIPIESTDLRASLPILPPLVESKEKGILIDLIKAIDEEYTEGNIIIQTYPFARALSNVIQGNADFEMPFLVNPRVHPDKLKFQYSSDVIFHVTLPIKITKIFVYPTSQSIKSKPIQVI